jgi:hypothetical protein
MQVIIDGQIVKSHIYKAETAKYSQLKL